MKILILRPNYYPEIAGGTRLAKDLVDDLIKAGHKVELIAPFPIKISNDVKKELIKNKNETEHNGNLKINRINIPIKESSILFRILKSVFLFIAMFFKGIFSKDVDLIMTISMPPFIGPLGNIIGKLKRVPIVYWEQDIISNSIKKNSNLGNKYTRPVIKWIINRLEDFSITHCTHVVTISNKFKSFHVDQHNVDPGKMSVIYNWIDPDQITYLNRNENPIVSKLKVSDDNFYVTYCGNIGYPHNLETLIDTAKRLESYENIKFLIFGDGSRKRAIERYMSEQNVKNVSLYPLVPLDEADQVYSLGDISIVIGQAGTSENGFPSKTWSIMSASRPVVSSFDLDSELTDIIRDNNSGIAVEPENSEALRDAILTIYNNRSLIDEMGPNGRKYVEDNISRRETTKEIIRLFESLAKRG